MSKLESKFRTFCETVIILCTGVTCGQLPPIQWLDSIPVYHQGKFIRFPWTGGYQRLMLFVWDWNADSIPDLIGYDRATDKIWLFQGLNEADEKGLRLYKPLPDSRITIEGEIRLWAAWKDVTGDGKPELFTALSDTSPNDWKIKVFKNCSSTQLRFCQWIDTLKTRDNAYVISNPIDAVHPVDIDKDGDVDFITFDPPGGKLDLYLNVAVDSLGRTDTLDLIGPLTCFGNVVEDAFFCKHYLDSCSFSWAPVLRHAGSTIAWVDLNGDTVPDLLVGDNICSWITALFLGRNADTFRFYSKIDSFPPEQPAIVEAFPAVYPIYINPDSQIDILVTPNTVIGGWDHMMMFAYVDSCPAPDTTCFRRVDSAFIVGQTLDVGKGSIPHWIDIDKDGRKDLLVSVWERRSPVWELNTTNPVFLRQEGPYNAPVFRVVTFLWDSFYLRFPFYNIAMTYGDIDGNGYTDFILGEISGTLVWLEDSSGPSKPVHLGLRSWFLLDTAIANVVGTDTVYKQIDVGQAAHPVLWDADGDGDLDLFVGNRDGKVIYIENLGYKGSTSIPFLAISDTLDVVNVKLPGELQGFAAPAIGYLDTSGLPYMLVGSWQGWLYVYRSKTPCIADGVIPVDTIKLNLGRKIVPAIGDLNGDSIPEIAIGTLGGGLRIFTFGVKPRIKPCIRDSGGSSESTPGNQTSTPVSVEESIKVYWAAGNQLVIEVQTLDTPGVYSVYMYDLLGRLVYHAQLVSTELTTRHVIPIASAGTIYIVKVINERTGRLFVRITLNR